MSNCPASLAGAPPTAERAKASIKIPYTCVLWLFLLAAAGIPLTLLWDFSWESTIGIDRLWAPAHTATYLAVTIAGWAALSLIRSARASSESRDGVRLGCWHAPIGAWLTAWGAVAFLGAVLFDRWWQSAYGLGAGIWHPPQISKAVAFFAVLLGVWFYAASRQNQFHCEKGGAESYAVAIAGGSLLAMISVVTLISNYPNRQHSAWFYEVGCATYPLVLAAMATGGKLRFPATTASVVYMLVICSMAWLLPLFPAKPQSAPVYNPMDHMMPPPFPLLLIVPALAMDFLLRRCSWPADRFSRWLQAGVAGLAFFAVFAAIQWFFARFLLSDFAGNWFFAGGGRHWPFFLKVASSARQAFWVTEITELNEGSALLAVGWAVLSSRIGLWLGEWMTRLRR